MNDAVRETMTINELIRHMQRFQSDCSHSTNLEYRWLCSVIQPILDISCQIGNCKLDPENRKHVNLFRAIELEREIDRKRRDMESLERDLKKVRAA